jgi:acyl carrier protein
MKEIREFRDMPGWPEVRKALKEEVGRDPNLVAEFGEIEGDSLDMVEATMAIEEAFGSRLKNKSSS